MCGRYTLKTDRQRIAERFGLEDMPLLEPRYNLGPTQDGLVVLPGSQPGTRTAARMRWGLIPSWARAGSSLPLFINARAETAAAKPAFRDAFRRRRCLVIADGFFEWSRATAQKQPFYFTADHGEPFAMAGLWDRWTPPAGPDGDRPAPLNTYTILTTSANDVLAPHHDRMPVILEREFYDDWLNPLLTQPETVERLLKPYPAMRMLARAVDARVNNVKFDDPACLDPPASVGPPSTARPGPGQLGFNLGD